MTSGPFDPGFADLPAILPIFPLPGALLLPGGRLPLNIFEKRYLAMVRGAMQSRSRIIGMIQPREDEAANEPPAVYDTGCAGRIQMKTARIEIAVLDNAGEAARH